MRDTQVYFPVSKDLALVGEFDREDKIVVGNRKLIALLNTKMLYNIYRQIYSPKLAFHFIGDNDKILDGNRILSEIKS